MSAISARSLLKSARASRDGEPGPSALRPHPSAPAGATGAGVSTTCSIPDYRDAEGRWKRTPSLSHQEFLRSDSARRRDWARSLIGWPRVAASRPNAAHRALAQSGPGAGFPGRPRGHVAIDGHIQLRTRRTPARPARPRLPIGAGSDRRGLRPVAPAAAQRLDPGARPSALGRAVLSPPWVERPRWV